MVTTHSAENARDLQSLLRKAGPRDTIELNGQFGEVRLAGIRPEATVTLRAAKPGAAHFEKLILGDCANIAFAGLTMWPLAPVPRVDRKLYLIHAYPDCAGIEVSDTLFRGRADSDNHAKWTLADWTEAKIGAALLRGPNSVIRNNAAIGVNFGYGVSGKNSEIFGNLIFGFSGDAFRATEDNCVVIGNRATDAMQVDKNHSDAFQAFKTSGLLNGLVVKDNVLVEWTVRPDNPLRAKMQGISFHGGPYANVIVRDNKVATTSPNGIHLNQVNNFEVTGNRVRNADGQRGRIPRIWIDHCSGNMLLADNEAENYTLQRGLGGPRNREPDYSVRF
jgi:hypothetical protein